MSHNIDNIFLSIEDNKQEQTITQPDENKKTKQSKEYFKQYREKNRPQVNEKAKEYYKKKVIENPEYRIKFKERATKARRNKTTEPKPRGRPKKAKPDEIQQREARQILTL